MEIMSDNLEDLLGDRPHPKGWKSMTDTQKLDYIATRMLAEDRDGTTSHTEIKDSGILSVSQFERRRSREVFSQYGELDTKRPEPGVFSRTHVRDIRGVRTVKKTKEGKDGQ